MITRTCPKCKKVYTEESDPSNPLISECNSCWAESLQDAVNNLTKQPDKYSPPNDKSIVSRFKRFAYNIFVTEKKAQQHSSIEGALELLKAPKSIEDLMEAADLLEAENVEPKDIDVAIQLYEADRGTADAYIQKAIGDVEYILEQRQINSSFVKEAFKFSSTQINLPEDIAKRIIEWGNKNIPEEEIFKDEKGDGDYDLGREEKPHITVKYGLHTTNSEDVNEIIKGNGKVNIRLGDVSIFEPEEKEYDVVKVDIESEDLNRLNAKVSTLKNSDEHPVYKPHATIAYVKKGQGKKYVGNQDFKSLSFSSDVLDFSAKTEDGKDNNHTMLKLI